MPENPRLAGVTLTNVVTLTNKTFTLPILDGTPSSAGQLGRDTTQNAESYFDNGLIGIQKRVLSTAYGSQTFINDTTGDQDFTSMMSFGANAIFTNKVYRVRILCQVVTGVSSVTLITYLKLGSVKIGTSANGNLTNSQTRSVSTDYLIFGRDAPGASQSVSCAWLATFGGGTTNGVNQPVGGIATNGTLSINFGLTYSGTGSTESVQLIGWTIEELN